MLFSGFRDLGSFFSFKNVVSNSNKFEEKGHWYLLQIILVYSDFIPPDIRSILNTFMLTNETINLLIRFPLIFYFR